MTVVVETAARLHFGVLDLRGSLGRWFGGIGAAARGPMLRLSAEPAGAIDVDGEDADRAAAFARKFQTHFRVNAGARIRVEQALPRHAGLGSGTQLALAVARAMAELNGVTADVAELAVAVGRTKRSAIGTWTFAGGGLVLEGGRKQEGEGVAPLLARIPFPPAWRCVVAVPDAASTVSGAGEAEAFAQLPPASEKDVEHVAHVVLMGLLPALVEADIVAFGAALSAIQTITGRWFASVQGGTFAPGPSADLIARMSEWGAAGVGQSSWGPTVYGIVDSERAGAELAGRVRGAIGSNGAVYEGPFRADGACIRR